MRSAVPANTRSREGVVETRRHRGEPRVELVEGAGHGMGQGEIAGEHAAIRGQTPRGHARSRGRWRRTAWSPSGMARPDSLHTTLSPRPARASMPSCQRANSSSESERGQPVCSTTTVRSSKPASSAAAVASRSGWAMSSKTRLRSCSAREHGRVGDGVAQRAHGAHAAEARCRHLAVEQGDGVGHRLGRRQPADDGVGAAVGLGRPVELDGLLDRVGPGGRGHVDELLDVPPGRLGPVGLDVEAPVHPRRRRRCRRGTGPWRGRGTSSLLAGSHRWTWASTTRVGLSRHRASVEASGPVAPTISRRLASSQSGMAGPP